MRSDKVAATDATRALTFKQVGEVSDDLARRLYALRETGNDVVGYLGAADTACMLANLASLKAGQCLVVLNPGDPVPAQQSLVEHAGIRQIIALPEFAEIAAEITGRPAVPVFTEIDASAGAFVPPPEEPEAMAFMRYTSGTTGRPKGAVTTREGLIDRWDRQILSCEILDTDNAANFHAIRLPEQLGWLSEGATQHFCDIRGMQPRAIVEWLNEKDINVTTIFAVLYRQLAAVSEGGLSGIEKLYVVGEPLFRPDYELFNRAAGPGCKLCCRYGTSEYGPTAQHYYLHSDPVDFDVSPIGTPLRPDDVLLLDGERKPVPEGEAGEIVVSSRVLPGGYYKDPDRSAGVYDADPNRPGYSLYFTGDLAYRNPEGVLRGLGRRDEQVKIRGYNVRPAEVEQMIQEHPDIREAAVSAFQGKNGIRRLACYYVVEAGAEPVTGRDLRAFLQTRAASYQVPGVYLAINSLPRTPTGKLARQSLPDPLSAQQGSARTEERHATDTEAAIARLWQSTLDHRDFGLEEDFFDVGGDSLQAMTLVTAIEAEFGIRVPLETLIVSGATVASLAAFVTGQLARRQAGVSSGDRVVVLRPGEDLPPLYVTHVMGGHLSDYLMIANALDPRIPLIGLHPSGLDRLEEPGTSIDELAAYCVKTIRAHQPTGPYHLMGFSFGAKIAFEAARQLGDSVQTLILLDPPPPRPEWMRFAKYLVRGRRIGGTKLLGQRLCMVARSVLGMGLKPANLDAAHQFASTAYQPMPLSLPNARVFAVFAEGNSEAAEANAGWRALIGPSLVSDTHRGDHMQMVGNEYAFSLCRKIENWLVQAR